MLRKVLKNIEYQRVRMKHWHDILTFKLQRNLSESPANFCLYTKTSFLSIFMNLSKFDQKTHIRNFSAKKSQIFNRPTISLIHIVKFLIYCRLSWDIQKKLIVCVWGAPPLNPYRVTNLQKSQYGKISFIIKIGIKTLNSLNSISTGNPLNYDFAHAVFMIKSFFRFKNGCILSFFIWI